MTGCDGENRLGKGLVGDEVTRTIGAWLESWAPGLLAESSQREVCVTQLSEALDTSFQRRNFLLIYSLPSCERWGVTEGIGGFFRL